MLNPATGEVEDFITAGTTQEDIFDPEELNKPIDVKCHGDSMLIVDFGVFEPGIGLQQAGTGKIWMVTRDEITTEPEQPEQPDDDGDNDSY